MSEKKDYYYQRGREDERREANSTLRSASNGRLTLDSLETTAREVRENPQRRIQVHIHELPPTYYAMYSMQPDTSQADSASVDGLSALGDTSYTDTLQVMIAARPAGTPVNSPVNISADSSNTNNNKKQNEPTKH